KIRPGLAFEAHEAVEIEHVAGRARVHQIGELDRRDADLARDIFELIAAEIGADAALAHTRARLLERLTDQVVELQNAAGARFERLAVGAVHRAEADMLKRFALSVSGFRRRAEDDLEMLRLALIHDVNDQIRMQRALAIENRRQISRAVHGRPFGRY